MALGFSLVSDNVIDTQKGVSLTSNNNVHVYVVDENSTPIIADLQINGTDFDGVYSGFSEYPFTGSTAINATFQASANGFITNSVNEDIFANGYKIITIVLQANTNDIGCDTIAILTENNVETSVLVEGGKLSVTFTFGHDINLDDYIVSFEGYKKGSGFESIRQLDGEIYNQTVNTLEYHFEGIFDAGEWCFFPNISLKQC